MSAKTDSSTIVKEIILNRKSYRAFQDKPISKEELKELFEAARWSASCFNEQPWRFICARREEGHYPELLECLGEWNQKWARNASALVITVAAKQFQKNGKSNAYAWHDVGQATAQMALRAVSLGLAIHSMAGFDAELARKNFAIPVDYEAVAAMAIGYPGTPEQVPIEMRESELALRIRKELDQQVFKSSWDEPYL